MKKMFVLICLSLFLLPYIDSLIPSQIANCVSIAGEINYDDPACINAVLEANPGLVNFKLIADFSKINNDLITSNKENLQKYISDIVGKNYKLALSGDAFTGVKYSIDGSLIHPKFGKLNFKEFPDGTEFTIFKDKMPLAKIPENSEINQAKVGNVEINKGNFYALDPRSNQGVKVLVKNEGGLIIKDGEIFLNKYGEISIPDKKINLLNLGKDDVHISLFGTSSMENSLSFANEKITALSSANGNYLISIDDKRYFLNSNGGKLELSSYSLSDLNNKENVRNALKTLGYDSGNYIRDVEQFQTDYYAKTRISIGGKTVIADRIVGTKTKNALLTELGEYSKISSNGDKFSLTRMENGNYVDKITKEGKLITEIYSPSPENIQLNKFSEFEVSNQKAYVINNLPAKVKIQNEIGNLMSRYQNYKTLFESASQRYTPNGITPKKFQSILAGMATMESSMGRPYGVSYTDGRLLMGYHDPRSNKPGGATDPVQQIDAAAKQLSSKMNNPTGVYSVCSAYSNMDRMRCILAIYNQGHINPLGESYANKLLAYAEKFEKIIG